MFQGDGQIDKKCRLEVRNQGGDRINAMVNACYGTLGSKLHLSNWGVSSGSYRRRSADTLCSRFFSGHIC